MTAQTAPQEVPPDPIYQKSLSLHVLIGALAVVLTSVWAMYDEWWGRRPYKAYQTEFRTKYVAYLDSLIERQTNVEATIKALDDYQELDAAVAAASAAIEAERAELQREINNLNNQFVAVSAAAKSPNSMIAALNYQAELAAHHDGIEVVPDSPSAQEYLEEIAEVKKEVIEYSWTEREPDGSEAVKPGKSTALELRGLMGSLPAAKAAKQRELGAISRGVGDATKARDDWLKKHMGDIALFLETTEDEDAAVRVAAKVKEVGAAAYLDKYTTPLSPAVLASLKVSAEDSIPITPLMGGDIEEIFIREANDWVDRCTTCHQGILSPVPITEDDVRGDEGHERLFVSHPRTELLDVHDTERFGCSTCHGGNGVAITNTYLAHGKNKYWLHKLHPPTNYEAGCVQCHEHDLVIPMGERISSGRQTFMKHGCHGCHRRQDYDPEPELIQTAQQRLREIDDEIAARMQRAGNLKQSLDTLFDEDEELFNERLPENQRARDALNLQVAQLRTEAGVLHGRLHSLYQEQKKVGPNLKEIRAKIRPEWLTQWIEDPTHWRPDTKMPKFRWAEVFGEDRVEDVTKDIAAFLWQAALPYDVPAEPPGNVQKGWELFQAVGCLGCHSIENGEGKTGGDFAANLSNLGEKANYDYVVRWIRNPRDRLAPYCPDCNRDLTPEDYAKKGLDFVFGAEYSRCPNCSHELQWANQTAMPSLRLSDQETRDIASFLVAQKRAGEVEAPAPWLDDAERAERGETYVKHFGCAGCHEIGGLEKEQRIGVELTKHGSKPLDRLDFGHFTLDAKRGKEPLMGWKARDGVEIFQPEKWYTLRGFFMHKLAEPGMFDRGKNVPKAPDAAWVDRLRMPRFGFTSQQIHDVTTYLMGSVDTQLTPDSFKHRPDDAGNAIREGWWIVKKYNCQGCHQVEPGDVPSLHDTIGFRKDEPHFKDLPPSLVSTGFRTQPAWLARFLHDPSLGGGRENPKAARPYLTTRMPTFFFTKDEIRKLVRFFDAMADQPPVYQKPELAPLTPEEKTLAKAIFDHSKCAQCHVVEGVPFSTETKAPNLSLAAERLRPEWYVRWLRDPATMAPGTAMPAFFKVEDGRWVYDTTDKLPGIDTYRGDHIDLMVRYLNSPDFGR